MFKIFRIKVKYSFYKSSRKLEIIPFSCYHCHVISTHLIENHQGLNVTCPSIRSPLLIGGSEGSLRTIVFLFSDFCQVGLAPCYIHDVYSTFNCLRCGLRSRQRLWLRFLDSLLSYILNNSNFSSDSSSGAVWKGHVFIFGVFLSDIFSCDCSCLSTIISNLGFVLNDQVLNFLILDLGQILMPIYCCVSSLWPFQVLSFLLD